MLWTTLILGLAAIASAKYRDGYYDRGYMNIGNTYPTYGEDYGDHFETLPGYSESSVGIGAISGGAPIISGSGGGYYDSYYKSSAKRYDPILYPQSSAGIGIPSSASAIGISSSAPAVSIPGPAPAVGFPDSDPDIDFPDPIPPISLPGSGSDILDQGAQAIPAGPAITTSGSSAILSASSVPSIPASGASSFRSWYQQPTVYSSTSSGYYNNIPYTPSTQYVRYSASRPSTHYRYRSTFPSTYNFRSTYPSTYNFRSTYPTGIYRDYRFTRSSPSITSRSFGTTYPITYYRSRSTIPSTYRINQYRTTYPGSYVYRSQPYSYVNYRSTTPNYGLRSWYSGSPSSTYNRYWYRGTPSNGYSRYSWYSGAPSSSQYSIRRYI